MRLTIFLLLLPFILPAQIWKGTGISYTRNMPTHNPGMTGAWVAIDTTSGDWYEWQNIPQSWREMGDRVQFTYTTGAPSWIPAKQRSRLALNAGDSLYAYQVGNWVLLNPSAGASYNQSLSYVKPVLSLTDAGGTLTTNIPDSSGSNYSLIYSGDTLRLTDQLGTLKAYIPSGGGGGGADTSGYNQSLTYANDTLSLTDGAGTLKVEIPQPIFPANLVLFATTASDTVATYRKLVTDLDDPNYDDPAVDVTTGTITTNQIIGRQISDFGLIIGNPGVIQVQTIGEVRRTAGTGTAEFYFEVYLRNQSGIETLLATSNNTPPITSSSFAEFQATALLNNGSWTVTDRIVIKFYADRQVGGSDPTYELRFGGSNPIRTTFPVPANILANVPIVINSTDVIGGTQGRFLTTDGSGTLQQGQISAGTGISISGVQDITISNSAPDQTVSLTGAGINSVSGTYPSFTITGTEVDGSTTNELQDLGLSGQSLTITNGTGVTLPIVGITAGTGISTSTTSGNVTITNTAPDQTVSITGAGINVASGTYPNFTITGTEVDGSTTNEIQTIDTFALSGKTVSLSLSSDAQPAKTITLPTDTMTMIIACSDETTNLAADSTKNVVTFTAPFAITVTKVKADVNTAPTGQLLRVDINEAGTSILSTKLTIDASEKTSETAATAAVISDSAIANNAEVTINIDQVGSTAQGKGLKVTIYYVRQ
jgi:hypothetical protein